MYWLIVTTLFWAHTFGTYATLEECEQAATKAPWYATANCIPLPKQDTDHKH